MMISRRAFVRLPENLHKLPVPRVRPQLQTPVAAASMPSPVAGTPTATATASSPANKSPRAVLITSQMKPILRKIIRIQRKTTRPDASQFSSSNRIEPTVAFRARIKSQKLGRLSILRETPKCLVLAVFGLVAKGFVSALQILSATFTGSRLPLMRSVFQIVNYEESDYLAILGTPLMISSYCVGFRLNLWIQDPYEYHSHNRLDSGRPTVQLGYHVATSADSDSRYSRFVSCLPFLNARLIQVQNTYASSDNNSSTPRPEIPFLIFCIDIRPFEFPSTNTTLQHVLRFYTYCEEYDLHIQGDHIGDEESDLPNCRRHKEEDEDDDEEQKWSGRKKKLCKGW